MTGLQQSIEALKDKAMAAFREEIGDDEGGCLAEGEESTEAPRVSLSYSLESGFWQACIVYDEGMGATSLLCGNPCDTPEDAVASLKDELA